MPHTHELQNHRQNRSGRYEGARRRALRLAATLFGATLIAAVWASEATTSPTSAQPCMQTQMVGLFTGKYVDGTPVYQLPSVSVVTTSRAELARLLRDERDAAAPGAKMARKRPA